MARELDRRRWELLGFGQTAGVVFEHRVWIMLGLDVLARAPFESSSAIGIAQ
jgi:hypothetical protein